MAQLKVIWYTVRASREQAARWRRVARYLGCRSVSAWLEELADEQARRLDHLAVNSAPHPAPPKDAGARKRRERGPYRRRGDKRNS